MRERINEVSTDNPIIVFCAVGLRGYLAQRILIGLGFKDVRNLSGGYKTYSTVTPSNTSKIITSVENKGLIKRKLDKIDKRKMHFSLTPKGEQQLEEMHCSEMELPDILLNIC